jgi:hypothetical protein
LLNEDILILKEDGQIYSVGIPFFAGSGDPTSNFIGPGRRQKKVIQKEEEKV